MSTATLPPPETAPATTWQRVKGYSPPSRFLPVIATLDKTIVFLGISSSATPAFKAIVIVVLCLLQSERVRGWFRTRRRVGPALPAVPTQKAVKEEANA